MRGNLITISAPSGAGKTSLVREITSSLDSICVSVSHTTRAQRPGEVDGKNYHFVDKNTFVKMIDNQDFLEYAEVFGNYYGTSKSWVETQLTQDKDVILEIDWQGAKQVRELMPSTISIFILPPSKEVLYERLTNRGQDEQAVIDARMAEAQSEMTHFNEADYLVVNDVFDDAANEIASIILAERFRLKRQSLKHAQLLETLLK